MHPGSAVYKVVIAEATSEVPVAEAGPSDPGERVRFLFNAHHQRLYRLACRLSGSAEDAKDLVQETFLRVARAPSSVPLGSAREEAWLVRVLVNICRDRWRQRQVRKRLDTAAPAPRASSNQESALIARSLVWRALETLPPRRRAVVVMYELEGVTIAAIAKQLGVTAVTVRWHLSRGRRELASIIGANWGDES
jgi:RNA polymerase sigma-70 factor (ECF subfamily)